VPKEITISMVDSGDSRLIFGSAHDISERKRHEAVLRSLLDDTAAVTGQAFFDALTARLVAVLGVEAAFIGEYLGQPATRMRTLSMCTDAGHLPPQEGELASSPGPDIPPGGFLLLRDDLQKRYPEALFLPQLGIQSYLGVPMQDTDGARLGHLSIMDTRTMPDDPALVSTLRLFAQRAAAELMRLRAERAIRASLHEKEVLLKEIHHRVKNNMQIVSSLLCLQARDITDPVALDLLDQSRARILSMALVHEDLYQTGNLAQVDFLHYLKRLAERVLANFSSTADVRFELDLDTLALPVDQAIPLGLLCNELFTNALKHAFPDQRQGVVLVTLRRSLGEAVISVRDNGQGLPPDFLPGGGATLGLQLVWSLAEQLHGQATAETDSGAVFTVCFPVA
jgi:two-component sensor histidine kinase